jgi:hypothetical protein
MEWQPGPVEVLGVRGPVGAVVAVPGAQLLGVGWGDGDPDGRGHGVPPFYSPRSLRRLWPRAQSKLYEEPKKLVAHGFARATDDSVGRRRRTRYTITAQGSALALWLEEPGRDRCVSSNNC